MTLKQALQGDIPCLYYPENRKFFELAVVNGRTGEHYLGRIREDGSFDFPTEIVKKVNGTLDRLMNSDVYTWTHTDKTMLIIL
ncbi:MAG: hypothetical protein LBS74_03030 [Oscillospiraceae bacterium]|jgi:hypothetical protein|nr:hypothetical protein [Oscillospiraceae bacterium]